MEIFFNCSCLYCHVLDRHQVLKLLWCFIQIGFTFFGISMNTLSFVLWIFSGELGFHLLEKNKCHVMKKYGEECMITFFLEKLYLFIICCCLSYIDLSRHLHPPLNSNTIVSWSSIITYIYIHYSFCATTNDVIYHHLANTTSFFI